MERAKVAAGDRNVEVRGGTRRKGRSRPGCWMSCRSIRSRCCSVAADGCSTSCRPYRAGARPSDRHTGRLAPLRRGQEPKRTKPKNPAGVRQVPLLDRASEAFVAQLAEEQAKVSATIPISSSPPSPEGRSDAIAFQPRRAAGSEEGGYRARHGATTSTLGGDSDGPRPHPERDRGGDDRPHPGCL
jgi:hypothetical protein